MLLATGDVPVGVIRKIIYFGQRYYTAKHNFNSVVFATDLTSNQMRFRGSVLAGPFRQRVGSVGGWG